MLRAALICLLLLMALPARADDAPMDLTDLRAKAQAGNPVLQAYLGSLYMGGQGGVERDARAAFQWYRKAAEQGNVSGEYNIGVMYDQGIGIDESPNSAYFWLALAAKTSGRQEYADRRDRAGMALTVAEQDDIKKRADAWKPTSASTDGGASAAAPAPAASAAALAPGVSVPWFRVPPPVQKTFTDNIDNGYMIGKIERAVEDGVALYRAQINKPGSPSSIIRVLDNGTLVGVGKLTP